MTLLYTLNDNFKATTDGLNTTGLWIVRLVLLTIAIAAVMLIGGLIMNGAPETISY